MPSDPPAAAAPPSATVLKECRHGRMLFLKRDFYIGRSLDLYGEFSESEGRLFDQLLAPGQIVAEVGANIGAHTVRLAKLVGPTGLVLAFEPQRIVFALLCANLMLNEQFHVQPVRAAVGNAQGIVKVPVLDPAAVQNFGGMALPGREHGDDVPLTTLDSYAFSDLRLLKIDVEGMEREVLLGARQTVARHRPVLYVENDRQANSPELIGLIAELGYQAYWHIAHLWNPDNFAGAGENVFANTASINLLCTPTDRPASVTGFRPVAGPDDWWEDHFA